MSTRAPVHIALIVAGGKGTRLQPLTHDVPKPLVPFCGAPFLEGVVRRLAGAGVTDVFLIVGDDIAPFEILHPVAEELGVTIEAVPEPRPLDTAGGVRAVADRFDGPVLVLNGDILTDVDYAAVGARHEESGADTTIVLTEVDDTSSYGVAVREGTRIVQFVEKPQPGTLPDENGINAGTYVIEPEVMLAHPEGRLSFERDVFPSLLDRGGHVEGMVWDGVWADLGTPARYRDGHRLALDGRLPWPTLDDVPETREGVRLAPDAEIHEGATVQAPVLVLGGARVAAGATIGPGTVLGRDCVVGPGSVLDGCVLHDGVEIGADVVASGLVAGHDAKVQPGAALGRDVVLGSKEVVEDGTRLADGERRPRPRA